MEVNETGVGGTGRKAVLTLEEPCVKALKKEGAQLVGGSDKSENRTAMQELDERLGWRDGQVPESL